MDQAVDTSHKVTIDAKTWRRPRKKGKFFSIDKRQKFVISTLVLSLGLFFTEFQLSQSGIVIPLILAILTVVFLFWAIRLDVKENRSFEVFLLPFFYSLSFGLFYFLTPTSFLIHLLLVAVYAFGMYSVFLSSNILVVSSIRTITLLSGARIVSFVAGLISYFFLTNALFALHINVFFVALIIFFYSFPLVLHSLWTYDLAKNQKINVWSLALSVCLVEGASALWFFPSSPTVIALFMSGFFYTIVGLSHIWFERRLFKGVMWEYVWVGCIVFFVLILFTPWGK